jgi:hypothetical protein
MPEDLRARTRSLVMLRGHCSACKRPAERHAGTGHWWHLGQVCEWRSVSVFRPVATYPLEGGGYEIGPLEVDLPARFIPDSPKEGT